MLHNYRVVDAFWFLNIERDYGIEEACRLNELVWSKVGALAVKDLKKVFNLNGEGLPALVQALRLFPWNLIVGYVIEERPEEVILTVPSCPTQKARLDHKLDEYPCQAMHFAEFSAIAREIDPRIKVTCIYAPPDPHPSDNFCRWRFTVNQ
ncbi:MAG: hypothetical protein HQK55_18920 [Deltaproteobacteria bacterium]|nr:hypothetical protein [Deltaproteobacteria bacterium]